ncbi:hypothetical protein [Nocardia sp. NPDC057353]|uniref:hypothetical protein n=1 Tax=Nocardia sp. NPDC057353 TaxID=3346104 RepID=UPI003639A863
MRAFLKFGAVAAVAAGLGAAGVVAGGSAQAAPTGCSVQRGLSDATGFCVEGDGVHRVAITCVGIMSIAIDRNFALPFPGQWSEPGPVVAPGTPSSASCFGQPFEAGIVIDAYANCGTPHPQWEHYIDWRRC